VDDGNAFSRRYNCRRIGIDNRRKGRNDKSDTEIWEANYENWILGFEEDFRLQSSKPKLEDQEIETEIEDETELEDGTEEPNVRLSINAVIGLYKNHLEVTRAYV
jgi:hypothetical protein